LHRFIQSLKSDKAFFFYRGGVALYALLKTIGIQKGDEVILPVFTCPAVPYPVMRLGAIPTYVDIDPTTFNIDPNKVEQRITEKAKAIIVQHTFGIPAEMDRILTIARKYDVWVIEDACHALGSRYNGQEVGTFGDAAIYSFGWYKPLVLGVGGAAVVNNPVLRQKILEIHHHFVAPPLTDLVSLYVQYAAYTLLLKPSRFWFMKEVRRRLSILGSSLRTFRRRKTPAARGQGLEITQNGSGPIKKMIAFQERRLFKKLDAFDQTMMHLEWVVARYKELLSEIGYQSPELDSRFEPVYYKYPLLSDHKKDIFERAKQARIEMSDMFGSPLYPPDRAANWEALGYQAGMCPISENVSARIVALPVHTRVQATDIEKTVALLASFHNS
jgi:perosamine synthetase